MRKFALMLCAFFLVVLPLSVSAALVNYSTTLYSQENIGNQFVDPPSGWDKLTIAASTGTLNVGNTPGQYDLQPFTFTTGVNSYGNWTTPNYTASWDMTVGSTTKTITQSFYVDINSFDTLYLVAATPQYFDLGAGQYLKLELLAQTIASDATGHIMANLQVVPIPAAAWLLGTGIVGLVALRRRQN